MKRCFCLFAAVWAVLAAAAQSLLCNDGTFHWESGISAALNNDGYELALRGYYFPIPYIGMKVELGFAGEIEEISDWDISWGDGWGDSWNDWGDESDYAIRFKFNPAIALRTPRLIHWKGQDAGFYLFTEPGIVLSPGASGSRNAQWFRWDVKSGINMQIDRYIFTLGYGISDFSLYSGRPVSHHGYRESKTDYISHTVFVAFGCKF